MPPLKQYKDVHPRAKSKSDLLLALIESFVQVLLWRWIKISLSWSRQVKSAPLPSSRKIRPVRSLYSCWIGFPHQGPQVGDVPLASPRQIEGASLPPSPGNVEHAFLVASCLLRLVSFPSSCQVRLGSLSRCWSEIFNNVQAGITKMGSPSFQTVFINLSLTSRVFGFPQTHLQPLLRSSCGHLLSLHRAVRSGKEKT